ncbi:MAG: M48 family metalloprotease, partial [Bradymonadia bacterium]
MKHHSALLVLSLFLFACGGSFISAKEERKLGKDVHSQILKEYKLIKPSHSLGKWATEFIRPLTKASNRFRSVNSVGGYRVYIIADDKLINAFAAPGGYTYISSGLILAADNCAEIAGVMGHELAHVTERHSIKKLESAMAVQTASGVILGEGSGSQTAQAVWGFFQNTTFSRED